MAPFEHRDVLIIYNVMLFAVMGLLLGATPVTAADLSARLQSALRKAIMVVAVMVVIVSLYALAAVIYRTVGHGLTVNRMTVIGWNSVNIGLLVLLLYRQLRRGRKAWVRNLQKTFGDGIFAYTAWGVFVTIAAPWLF
jgi:fumarate reductase subunit D